MTRRVLLLVLLLVPAIPGAQQSDVSGVVFIDANSNGARDSGEQGLASVVVSNQDAVVATDASGAYRLTRGATGVVFVSVPDGHRTVGSSWKRVGHSTSTVDFPLAPVERSSDFTFIHASDTHIAPAVLARTQRFRELAESLNPAFVIITGDLVRDALRVGEAEATGYYELFTREAALFKSPVYTVPGNHEIFGVERSKSGVSAEHPLYGRKMFHHYQGPDYYSFNYGGVHFVGLNTIDIDDQWYYGHIDSLQLAWLERDLAMVPETMPVVTFNHIPFFSSFEGIRGYDDGPPAPTLITVNGKTAFRHTVSNAREVLAVLRQRRHVLALGGHVHAGEQIEYEIDGLKTRFSQAPAIVGPTAGAGMRFPSGFMVYTVRDGVIDAGRFVPLDVDDDSISEPDALIGTWRVVSYETWNPQGEVSTPFGHAPSGYAVFDATGHAFIQLMSTSPGAAFAAYYGTYNADHATRVVTIRVEGSNVPSYIGTDQVRPFRIDGETLTLGVPNQYRATLIRVKKP